MEGLVALKKGIQRINLYLCSAGMLLLIPMMLLTAADVIGRAAWARPIPGAVEVSSYMLAVFILLGVAYTHQVKGHVRVSMIVSRLPEVVGLILDIVTTLLSLLIIFILAWQGWVVGVEERAVSDMLRVPQLPFRLLVSVAGVLLCLELLIDLSDLVRKLVRGKSWTR
ncbi:MAG: TRAP transporter small permease [Deltaproteobacteria bacterium]|nr:TRAP transporter small permease [Deltaproteobacteria bacterium]MBW2077371.1 TRAP transporter small permease [Deltaproteobacteria bacterium]